MANQTSNDNLAAGAPNGLSLDRLRSFFNPRNVALVGVSETSLWSQGLMACLRAGQLPGRIVPVHPRHETVFGLDVARSLREVDDQIDLAFVLAPTHAVEDVLTDAHAAGVHNVIVLASGYGEVGEEGRELERRLVEHARALDITMLGPNCMGYVNAAGGATPFSYAVPEPLLSGPVGVVLQSGALTIGVMDFAHARAIGVSLLVSMGNEAMMTAPDAIEYLIADDNTRSIALFLESIRQPDRFRELAGKALDAGKPIVALKVGRTEGGQQAAMAHTGAVTGDDAVTGAALRQLGVIRVNSLEELMGTAALVGYTTKTPKGRRMGVVTASGGACDIIADRADDEGLQIPDFSDATKQKLGEFLPPFAAVRNPLDVTGYGAANAPTRPTMAMDDALEVALEDPNVDFVSYMAMLPKEAPPNAEFLEARMDAVADMIDKTELPVVCWSYTCTDITPYQRQLLGARGMHIVGGIELAMSATGHLLRWTEQRERRAAEGGAKPAAKARGRKRAPDIAGSWAEDVARDFVAGFGVPVVPGELATSSAGAVAAAQKLGFPVALKICSADITHKSDIGGVVLDLTSASAVRDAYRKIRSAAAAQASDADVRGVLVTPMRTGGVELLAGVSVDPTFGPVLAVGLGGVWVEAMKDVSLRVLPVDEAEVERMLRELRGYAVLAGGRGGVAFDLAKVAKVAVQVAESAIALDDRLEALEINPLWTDGHRVEALDVLVSTTAGRTAAAR